MPLPPTTLIHSRDAAPDEWRLSHADVTSPYRCPLCDRSAEAAVEGLVGMEFGVCPEILPQPICEACWRELPYLLSSTAEGSLNSRRPLLRLAELRGVSDERVLVIAYVEDTLAHNRDMTPVSDASVCSTWGKRADCGISQGVSRRTDEAIWTQPSRFCNLQQS